MEFGLVASWPSLSIRLNSVPLVNVNSSLLSRTALMLPTCLLSSPLVVGMAVLVRASFCRAAFFYTYCLRYSFVSKFF